VGDRPVDYSRKMELELVVRAMSALAQLTRLRCYVLLREKGELTAGELATALEVPANTMSSHLAILGTAGLVTSTRQGRNIIYRADLRMTGELEGFLGSLPTAA
jgi:ArsR family transcriptional regulator